MQENKEIIKPREDWSLDKRTVFAEFINRGNGVCGCAIEFRSLSRDTFAN